MITWAVSHHVLENVSRRICLFGSVASSPALRFLVLATRFLPPSSSGSGLVGPVSNEGGGPSKEKLPGGCWGAAAEWDVARRRTLRHRALRGTLGALGVEVARVEGAEFWVALSEVAEFEVVEFGVALFEAARVEDASTLR